MQNLPGVRRDDVPSSGGRALGGVAMRPLHALVGEAGPELIAPLDWFERTLATYGGNGSGDTTIVVELDGNVLTRAVAPRLFDQVRVKTGVMPV